jgi:hypothetical protein
VAGRECRPEVVGRSHSSPATLLTHADVARLPSLAPEGEYPWQNYWAGCFDLTVWIAEVSQFIAAVGVAILTLAVIVWACAKASSWSGTVSQSGRRVVFRVTKGSWPAWSSLARSGEMLYGVANNPATGADIEIKLERASRGSGRIR